jgi:transposase-like protein
MRGPKPKYSIALTSEQDRDLRRLVQAHKSPQGQVVRAGIVLAVHDHPEWSNQQIARAVGCADRTVRNWRRWWNERHDLADRPRPGAPRRFSPGGSR